ncbi:peptidoglycan glycosyltransferase FtsW [Criblamydia sequanensis]|uniref:Probable peptidoglycan glycosyltransferase FtsW n=1 Tax=Candidatus Criblamydia sequanensis CRIB-18 TaxID=1437425 RepID=A0A090D0K5_9BACT|nr:putative peptidoglycan glycosyltransferase FtsW [Criblamydia sequanensis]CDR35072.1 Septum-peptidoglycan biosynthetic protein [Criblamydia sequanensis CRIB-18]
MPPLLLFLIGLVVIFSTTSASILDGDQAKSTHHAIIRQFFYFFLALILSFLSYRAGYLRFLKISPFLFWAFVFLLVLTLIPGIGKQVNGARRWIGAQGFYFQPSEFVKVILPSYFIYRLSFLEFGNVSFGSFMKEVFIALIPVILILIEPNNGTAAVLLLSLIVLFYLMKIKAKYWALPLLLTVGCGALFASQLPYVSRRLEAYLHPEKDLQGKGHQPYQAKIAAGSGKLFGKGPGKSLQKLSYLPEAQNDYIAAIFAEEYGFTGITLIIFLYGLIAYFGFEICFQTETLEGYYLSALISFLISFQAFLNLGVVSGILPSTGLNLPFFSQGGTSLMANALCVSLLVSISTRKKEPLLSN